MINKLCANNESSAADLAEYILKDASPTSRILKFAHSVHYNPNIKTLISTISRAVVLPGFSGIKSILLMTMLIEHALKNGDKKRMLKCLVSHVLTGNEKLLDEAFIYGLVYDVAEMAFGGGHCPTARLMAHNMKVSVIFRSQPASQPAAIDIACLIDKQRKITACGADIQFHQCL